jgi:phospholipid/cholesterol/gamma-HCH transport system permease protein
MVSIANVEARKITGNLSILGPAYFELLVREFGPIICALLCAARVGASHSAELSAMTVGEQVEALEMSAGDPLADLVAPRMVAGFIGLPVLTVLGTVAAAAAAVITAYGFGADGRAFIDARFVTATDITCGAVKAFACGLYIPLSAAWRGLRARGGASAVGSATTDGVVSACFGCLLIDFLVAHAFGVARA